MGIFDFLTSDIAIGLQVSLEDAEKIKIHMSDLFENKTKAKKTSSDSTPALLRKIEEEEPKLKKGDEIDLSFLDISGKKVENTLVLSHITVNKNMVPFDTRSPFLTSGLRVGTPAITTRGLKEKHMDSIVELIDEVISNIENEEVIKKVGHKVIEMMKPFPLFTM